MKKVFGILTILLTAGLFFTSCDPESEVTDLDFHFHPTVGSEDFAFNQNYDINGKATLFSLAQFYIHGITLGYEDGTEKVIDNYYLVKAGGDHYELGEVPNGKVTSIKFNIGVDTVNNHQTEENFTSRASDDPLAIQSPVMHWSWNMGYIFAKVEGAFDSDGDGTPETGIEYHVGMDSMLRTVELTTDKEVTGNSMELMIGVDFSNIFKDIDLETTPVVHGMSGTFMNNLRDAFTMM